MNDKTLVERLKEAEHFYVGAVSPLFREAAEEIERLNQVVNETTHANADLIKRNIGLGWDNNRLAVELNNLRNDARVQINKQEVVKAQDLQREAIDLFKVEAERARAHSKAEVERNEKNRRDMFACAALYGMLANGVFHSQGVIAIRAFQQADAMLDAGAK
jgi:hypothetical protein